MELLLSLFLSAWLRDRLLRLIRAFKSMSKSKELIVLLGGTSKAARTPMYSGHRAAEVLDCRCICYGLLRWKGHFCGQSCSCSPSYGPLVLVHGRPGPWSQGLSALQCLPAQRLRSLFWEVIGRSPVWNGSDSPAEAETRSKKFPADSAQCLTTSYPSSSPTSALCSDPLCRHQSASRV